MNLRRLAEIGLVCAAACAVIAASAQSPAPAHELAVALNAAGLDPAQCYRIRDAIVTREDARFYLTDGYLIFGRPVNGAPVTAVFSADTEGGDGEVLMLPPDRAERRSLAAYTGTPTLDEHITGAVFVFSGAGDRAQFDEIRRRPGVRNAPDIGVLLAERWNSRVAAAMSGLEARLALDLLGGGGREGFFQAFLAGRKLGSFDIAYDPHAYEQLSAGQVVTREGRAWWDTWTSFAARSRRNAAAPAPEIQVLSYRIEVALDAELNLRCVTRIRVRATEESRSVIPFDLSGQMRVSSAAIDGATAEVYQRETVKGMAAQPNVVNATGNELILVVPPHSLEPGSEHEVEIRHEGHVITDRGNGVYFVGARGNWYPNRGAQFATYDVTYSYPKDLSLVGAGVVKEDRIQGDRHVTRRVPSGPVRLLAFNVGQFERKQTERNGVALEIVSNSEIENAIHASETAAVPVPVATARPGRGARPSSSQAGALTIPEPAPVSQMEHIAQDVADAIAFYRARFGAPPLDNLEVSPVPGTFGQGFAGMLYLSTLSYLPATARPLNTMSPYEQAFYGELLRAHETAHQWWGNVVTTASYHHEWLLEALANYSALLFLESHKGPKFTEGILDAYRAQLVAKGPDGLEAEAEGPLVQGRRLESSANPNAWNAVAYGKGTWVLHMLRRRMGDAPFLKMLAELRRRFEFRDITTEDFRLLCAEFLPAKAEDPKLEDFFDVWVYGTGIPGLRLTYAVKGTQLTATVTQTGVPDDFSVLVPVEIQTGRGKVTREVRTASEPVTITVPVAGATAKAVLDPASSVLRR